MVPIQATLLSLVLGSLSMLIIKLAPRRLALVAGVFALVAATPALYRILGLLLFWGAPPEDQSLLGSMAIHTAILIVWFMHGLRAAASAPGLRHGRPAGQPARTAAAPRRCRSSCCFRSPAAAAGLFLSLAFDWGNEAPLRADAPRSASAVGAGLIWWLSEQVEGWQKAGQRPGLAPVARQRGAGAVRHRPPRTTSRRRRATSCSMASCCEEALGQGRHRRRPEARQVHPRQRRRHAGDDRRPARLFALGLHPHPARRAFAQRTRPGRRRAERRRTRGRRRAGPRRQRGAAALRFHPDDHRVPEPHRQRDQEPAQGPAARRSASTRCARATSGKYRSRTMARASIPTSLSVAFNPLARGVHTAGEGTGIGLSTCRNIIQSHGGEIRVDPAYRNGARIEFTLPAQQPAG